MQKNKLRYLVAGIIGAGAFLLASAGASAHFGSVRTVSDKSPTPSVSGAAAATIVDEVDAPEAATTPEPTEIPATAATAAEPAGANVEQEGEFQGQFGDTSGGDTGD